MKALGIQCVVARSLCVAIASLAAVLSWPAVASEEGEKQKPRALPKSGLLAMSSVSGAGSSIVSDVFGGEDIFGQQLPAISGSVSRQGDSSWSFEVRNNSEDRYSVNVDFRQKNAAGSTVSFGSYSYSLRPGERNGQTVSAGVGARSAELMLRSYRNLTQEQEQRKNR